MPALDHKLLRECWQLRAQLLSIALVVATGIMTVITMRGSYDSLVDAQQRYYQDSHFADIWVSLRRAPESLADELATIPGVQQLDTRVTMLASLDIPELSAPAIGQFVSIPPESDGALNQVIVRAGRHPDRNRPDEIILNEKFAEARRLGPGDSLRAIINGRARDLRIVGTGISAEYSYPVPPGSLMPDDQRYAVVWMGRQALAAALDMEGSFNDVALRLSLGAQSAPVISALDEWLEPWGGNGAHTRQTQASHMMLQGELDQNRIMGSIIPGIFLAVAVFLLHLVLGRLIRTQRGEIAVLKAFGYSNLDVGAHYLLFALVAGLSGAAIGTLGGLWAGDAYIDIYREYFDLPGLQYRLSPSLLGIAVAISMAGAVTGALGAVRAAVLLPPAEAMRPEKPASFRAGWLERIGMGHWLPPAGRMILRNIERKPLQSLLSAVGVAMAVAILVVGFFMLDGVRYMMDLQFRQIQREDVSVVFMEQRSSRVRHELQRLPGVTGVELYRTVPVRLEAGHRHRDTALQALPPDSRMRRIINVDGREHTLPAGGLVLSRLLADILQVGAGDTVNVRLQEGRRQRRDLTVSGVVDDLLGLNAYISMPAMERLSGESDISSGAWLRVRPGQRDALLASLKDMPDVASARSPANMLAAFESEMARGIFISVGFLSAFASVIATGVIYNGARIALSERGRELASLRVMGFYRHEVSTLLLGEQAIITVLAIPMGWAIGYAMAGAITGAMQTEAFRIPYVVAPGTWLWSALITMAAALVSALAVRRRLHRYDLVQVLKTRE